MRYNKLVLPQEIYAAQLKKINGVALSQREIDVIACVLSGRSAKGIAHFLSISYKTVQVHAYNAMKKLECTSRESMIALIESSSQFLSLKEYYLSLLTYSAFEKCLKEVAKLGNAQKFTCVIAYWDKNETPFFQNLKNHLTLAGIAVLLEAREKQQSFSQLLQEARDNIYTFYALPRTWMERLQIETDESLRILHPSQRSLEYQSNILFLLTETDQPREIPQRIREFAYVDCAEQKNYYFSVFEVLKKFLPNLELEKIIVKFTGRNDALNNFSNIYPSPIYPIEEILDEAKNPVGFQLEKFLHNRKWHTLSITTLILSLSFLGYLTIKKNHEEVAGRNNKGQNHLSNQKTQANFSVRSDLVIPAESTLLKRSELIAQIDSHFQKKHLQGIQAIALVGIGGSGKTVLAREYARRHEGIVWETNSKTKRSLRESFENFAFQLSITEEEKRIVRELKDLKDPEEKEEKIILFVKERLKANPNWLLIFDDVDNFTDIGKYYPSDSTVWGKGTIIVITRNSNIDCAIQQTIFVKELTAEDKLELFLKILNTSFIALTDSEKEKAQSFLKTLPSFPLDICVAAYYLKATQISYDEYKNYIREYKSDFENIQQRLLREVGLYSQTRYKIITLSLEKIIKESKDFSELLLFVSLIGSCNIPKEMLERFKSPIIVDDFIQHLKKYSLANNTFLSASKAISCITIHQSTQDIALTYLSQDLDKDSLLLRNVFYTLDSYINKALEEENFLRMSISVAHAEAFIKHLNLLPDFTKVIIESKLGCMYYFLNDEQKAQQTLKASVKNLKAYREEEKGIIAKTLLHIGNVYTELSNYEDAKEILKESLLFYINVPVKNYLKISWCLSHLANVYRRLGYYAKAKDLLEESLAFQNQYNSKKYSRNARTLAYLGSVYRGLGCYEKSIEILEKSLKLYQEYFPKNHYRIGWVLSHLGNVYRKLGDYEHSIKALEESLKIHRMHFSENHITIGLMLTYLGKAYRGQGDYEKAKKFLEEGLKIHKRHFQPTHERIGKILFLLGKVYKDLGSKQNSSQYLKQALVIYKNDQGKGEIEQAYILRNMGTIYLLENHLEEAEILSRKSWQILNEYNHPEAYTSLENLAEIFLEKSQQAVKQNNQEQSTNFRYQAIDQLQQALYVIERHFPKDSEHNKRIRLKIKQLKDGLN